MRGKRTSDYLLVDISNSYTKLAFATKRRLGKPMRCPTKALTVAGLRRILHGRSVETVVVSSVVPQKNKVIVSAAGPLRVLFLEPAT